jgi:hypothetical protein
MKNIWLWLTMLISVHAQSQDLTELEYFFDSDPGVGNGVSIPVTAADSLIVTTTIPTNSLDPGMHKLFIRTKDEDGIWSLFEGRSIYIQGGGLDTSSDLIEAEYFFDDDPGLGNGTALPASTGDSLLVDTTVPTTSLGPGFHKIFVRTKNQLGVWSLYEGRTIYIQPPADLLEAQLSYAEYFYDDDPGLGNGVSFDVTAADSLSFESIVPTIGLPGGFHKLFVRTMNTSGTWSLYEGRTVYIHVPNLPDTQVLTEAEYFFDTEPEIGNGIAFDVIPDDSLMFNASIDITGMQEGFHHLFVRAKNNEGKWSLYEGRTFYLQSPPPADTMTLVAAEYYFDSEPGIGLGSPLEVIAGDSIDANFVVPQSLPAGVHTMFLRVQSSTGDWSLFEARTFDITVGVEEWNGQTNTLFQNYPNPFSQSTQFEFYLMNPEKVTIEILDISGKLVDVIPLQVVNSGKHKLVFEAGELAEGSYHYRIITPTFTETRKMLLVK